MARFSLGKMHYLEVDGRYCIDACYITTLTLYMISLPTKCARLARLVGRALSLVHVESTIAVRSDGRLLVRPESLYGLAYGRVCSTSSERPSKPVFLASFAASSGARSASRSAPWKGLLPCILAWLCWTGRRNEDGPHCVAGIVLHSFDNLAPCQL
jgi:hypothetical protein